jgi:DHA3 family macrolide efflux protein-like MFS transporter
VSNYLSNDVIKLGLLGASLGLGISAGGLILSTWGGFKKRIYTIFSGLIVWSIAIFVFGFTTESSFYLGLAMWFAAGLCNVFINSPVATILQSTVPKDMQGRVFTTLGSLCTAMFIPSLLIAGHAADTIGVRVIYQISGGVMLPIVIIALFSNQLRNIEKQKR